MKTSYAVFIKGEGTPFEGDLESAIRFWDRQGSTLTSGDRIEYQTVDGSGIVWAAGNLIAIIYGQFYVSPRLTHRDRRDN